MRDTWKSIRRWLFGRAHRNRVQWVDGGPERSGLHVCIPLEGRLDEVRADLVVSDRFGPAAIPEIVAYAARHDLPIDGWVVRGVGALPFARRRVARWLASLGAAAHVPVFIDVDPLDPEIAERLAARLRSLTRHGAGGATRRDERRVG